jgi:hypothetical protein
MQNLGVTGPHFGGHDPDVFGKVHLHENVLIIDRTGGGNFEVLRHFDDHVRFNVPPILESYRRRHVLRVAFNRAAVSQFAIVLMSESLSRRSLAKCP